MSDFKVDNIIYNIPQVVKDIIDATANERDLLQEIIEEAVKLMIDSGANEREYVVFAVLSAGFVRRDVRLNNELDNLNHTEGADLLAEVFNLMTNEQKDEVSDEIAERIGRFMSSNGYRMIFNCWYKRVLSIL